MNPPRAFISGAGIQPSPGSGGFCAVCRHAGFHTNNIAQSLPQALEIMRIIGLELLQPLSSDGQKPRLNINTLLLGL